VKRLLHKIDTTGSADRNGSGRRRTARTDENVNRVEDHLKERLTERTGIALIIIDRAMNQWRDRLRNVFARKGDIEHDLNSWTVSTDIITVFGNS